MSNLRCRNYALITYHSEEVIKTVLQTYAGRIRHWAYILHDKDIYPEDVHDKKTGVIIHKKGEKVESHYHLLLCMNNPITLSAVRALFPIGANTLGQAVRDKADCFNYLNHKDKPDKYQYPDEAIICDDLDYWKGMQSGESDDRTVNIIEDILAGVLPSEMMKRYGRDYVINRVKYWEYAKLVERTERRAPEKLPEGMTVEKVNPYQDTIFENVNPDTGEVMADFEIKTPDPMEYK